MQLICQASVTFGFQELKRPNEQTNSPALSESVGLLAN